ncbi:hypothetical protein BDN67DRAFT_981963 [Paxillus ammoniavirescens]|nr:hypothetical protein BDN67DRAFT_981963 [Paxillus ammoniavirescens]
MHAHAVPPPHSELLAQCVFFNPELLDTIFNFLDKKTNVTNALVCKQWSQIALDVVWKEVDDLVLLLNLLKPVFKAMPEANDWLRFQRYASRVRCLRFHSNKYTADVNRLLDDVAISRTYLDILPNMHTLEWISDLEDTMARGKLFLHQRLRHLTITADGFRPRNFHMDICTRASHLHTLKLFIKNPQKHHKNELRTLVRNLPELRKIVLPEFHFTSSLIEDLSRAKNIRVVELNLNTNVFCGASKNVETFAPVLAEGAFPSLLNLGLVAKIDHLDRFFRCVLEFDMTWDGWYFEDRIVEERRQRQLLWKAISALLPGLIPVREEQDNSTVLREEVEDIYEIAC